MGNLGSFAQAIQPTVTLRCAICSHWVINSQCWWNFYEMLPGQSFFYHHGFFNMCMPCSTWDGFHPIRRTRHWAHHPGTKERDRRLPPNEDSNPTTLRLKMGWRLLPNEDSNPTTLRLKMGRRLPPNEDSNPTTLRLKRGAEVTSQMGIWTHKPLSLGSSASSAEPFQRPYKCDHFCVMVGSLSWEK